jgi:hypothetical protein
MKTRYTANLDGKPVHVELLEPDLETMQLMLAHAQTTPARFSTLKKFIDSPLSFLTAMFQNLEEETLSQKLGAAAPGKRTKASAFPFGLAVHHIVLGTPQKVVAYTRADADAYAQPTKKRRGVDALFDPDAPPPPPKGVQRRGAAWDAFQADHADKVILLGPELESAKEMAQRILRSKNALRLLYDGTHLEKRIDWSCKGVAMRSTPDALRPKKWVTDLKTCQSTASSQFVPQLYRYLYHAQLETYCQAGEYRDGARPDEAWIVAIDKDPKRPPRCFMLPGEALELGAKCLGKWIEMLKVCLESNAFPFDDVTIAEVPPYLASSESFDEYQDDTPLPDDLETGSFA